MPKDINKKATFNLKVRNEILLNTNIDQDFLVFILSLAMQSDLKYLKDEIVFKCGMDCFNYIKEKEIDFIKYESNKDKTVHIKLNKGKLKEYFDFSDETFKRDVINYFINNDKVKEYIKFNFILYGTVTNPENSYHLELKMLNDMNSYYIVNLCKEYGLHFKYVSRKNGNFIYLKEAENIADFLRIIGANSYLLEFENVRIVKEVRNNINRKQNCEIANMNKVISTAVKQQKAIQYINDTVGLDYLPDSLIEIAKIRLETENLTLQEIGELITPKINKSAVNYRLKKIMNLSEEIRRNKND